MCGFDPVRYKKPIEGNIQLVVSETPFGIHSYFDEQCADPYCKLTVVVHGAPDRGP